jgi:hypothetical protein
MAIDRDSDGPPLRRSGPRRDDRDDRDDLRATPFTEEVFEDERRREGRGRPFGLVVGVVLGVAIVGGVLWYAFRGPGTLPLSNGEVQTVKADNAPYKVKPENPGGMQVENQDKLVYDRVSKGAAPNRVETLLPPPEVPKAPPVKGADGMTETTIAKAPEPKAPPPQPKEPETKPVQMVLTETKPAAPKPAAKAEPQKAGAKAEAGADEKALQAMVKAANQPPKAVASAKPATDPLAAAVAAATGTAPKPAPAASGASGGGFQVQLAAVSTQEAAQAEWKRVSARHKELAGLTPAIVKADLGDKGTYYRLRAGPLADKAAADGLCSTLAADKIGCIVIKP